MKKLFARGLGALLPMVLTIFVVYFVVTTLYVYVAVPVGEATRWLILNYSTEGEAHYLKGEGSETFFGWLYRYAPWFGLVIGFILTLLLGGIVATLFGKRIWHAVESLLIRLPVVNVVYPYAKQFTEFFSSGEKKMEFKNAVAVPYPHPGLYSVGFITSEGLRHLNDHAKKHLVSVFVPTSPTPISGFVCYIPREEVIPLPISVDEALRLIISCGVLIPPHQAVSITDFAAAAASAGKPLPPVERGA